MTTRRGFLATVFAASALPGLTWADAGSPAYLAAAKAADGSFALAGLTAEGMQSFVLPLPARGHAACGHPTLPQAVVFARRPGTYALVIDCAAGQIAARLEAPEGHHFYGHGVFSAEGDRLFTTENDIATNQGRIGVWAAQEGYRRIGDFASGGIGPHDILRLPGRDVLAVANGGIITALNDDRTKLNIDTMQPNLTYLSLTGEVRETVTLAPEMHKNSIRHLAVRSDGLIGFAMQWEGPPIQTPPLLGLHAMGGDVVLAAAPDDLQPKLANYIGSIAFDQAGSTLGLTSPKGSVVALFTADGQYTQLLDRPDVCGIGAGRDGFMITDGYGGIAEITNGKITALTTAAQAWDNHLIAI